jgi:catechol 2,3-dioxygenase-like lactoylglutathione lyase family enzyme
MACRLNRAFDRKMMKAKYKHTNIVARDWRRLARFYCDVLGCALVPPERDLSGDWLSKGTGVHNARFAGAHLRLPGHGDNGPTLEIYEYSKNEPRSATAANREGIMHLAFEVASVEEATSQVLKHGGSKVGEVVSAPVSGVGLLTFVYVADPEGNIIELQSWK